MPLRDKVLKFGLPLLVIALGVVLMQLLFNLRQAPEPREKSTPGPLVEAITLTPREHQVVVHAAGTVQARRELTVIPRVSGEVVEMGANFINGGFVEPGDLLLRIDPTDYELALRKSRAAVVRAQVKLEDIESRADIARREWDEFTTSPPPSPADEGQSRAGEPGYTSSDPPTPVPSPLALYEPQVREAEAELSAAEAEVAAARLNLQRTEIRAPFAARVKERKVEKGQFVGAGAPVASLTGSSRAEVVVPLPPAELPWLKLPGSEARERGSAALVILKAGEDIHQWNGSLERTLGEVDPLGRMIPMVVVVDHPYAQQQSPFALLPGMFVEVQLAGRKLEEVFILPRRAVRDRETVWLLDRENRLRRQKVEVLRREGEELIIKDGLKEGDRVIVTDLAGAVEGMQLRVGKRNSASESGNESTD